MLLKLCPVCDHVFTARRINARYCSAACRQKHYRQLHGQKMTNEECQERIKWTSKKRCCVGCGVTFWAKDKGRAATFCSNECRHGYWAAKRRALINWLVMWSGQGKALCDQAIKEMGVLSYEKIARDAGYRYVHIQRAFTTDKPSW